MGGVALSACWDGVRGGGRLVFGSASWGMNMGELWKCE